MVAWLFPGQGAQSRGMGAALFARYPRLVAAADAQLGYSIEQLCLEGPDERLRDTRHAQPALFVVEALTYLDRAEREPAPDFLAGHSLGEYAALFAAGCFDFETGVQLVRRRGELMSRASGGRMAAVVGPIAARISDLLAEWGCDEIDVANDNAPDQVVLSGPVAALDSVAARIAELGEGRCVPLAVSAAFHSRAMAPAAQEYGRFLAGFELADPAFPVLSNVTARPYPPGAVAELLTAQVRSSVRWTASMRYLLDRGESQIAELGPGTVLTGLWRANRRAANIAPATPVPAGAPIPAAVPAIAESPARTVRPETLGSAEFRRDFGLRYAYLAGGMYHAVASVELVARLGQAGLLGFFGAGGLSLEQIDDAISALRARLGADGRFGMNLLCTLDDPQQERAVVELYLRRGVRVVEAASYPQVTAALAHYRFAGAYQDPNGKSVAVNRIVAKVSRPEVAAAFLSPPPRALLDRLVADERLTRAEALAAASLPMSDDLCIESDSGGHTDGGVALALLPSMLRLRDELCARHGYPGRIRIGAAGGLGAPEALAAAFMLGADFVVTGSVNQCTPQAGTSDAVRDLLAALDVQDTAYAPAGDLFELGAQVQVARKGTLFAARANKLYQLYRQHGSLDAIDEATRTTIERDYFGRTFEQIWKETAAYLAERHPERLRRAERDPRVKAALVMRWYFRHSTEVALSGDAEEKVNYQVHCGPAMGAFNAWVKGTDLEDWRARDVDVIAQRLMEGAARCLEQRLAALVPEPAS